MRSSCFRLSNWCVLAKIRKLTEQEIEWLIDDTLHGRQIDQTIEKFDTKWTRATWSKLLKEQPEVKRLVDEAEADSVEFLANDLLNVHRNPNITSKDMAVQYSNNLKAILAARKPEKYGNKIDLNLNGQISIKGNIEKANERIAAVMREVGPAILKAAKDKE